MIIAVRMWRSVLFLLCSPALFLVLVSLLCAGCWWRADFSNPSSGASHLPPASSCLRYTCKFCSALPMFGINLLLERTFLVFLSSFCLNNCNTKSLRAITWFCKLWNGEMKLFLYLIAFHIFPQKYALDLLMNWFMITNSYILHYPSIFFSFAC